MKSKDVEFTELFDPDVIGDGPSAAGYQKAGVPYRFAHIQYGAKGAEVGYSENGIDISNKWAAKGTAGYVSTTIGIPIVIEDIAQAIVAPVTAAVTLQIRPEGVTRVIPSGAPFEDYNWSTIIALGIGAGYEIEFTQLSSNGKGTLAGVTLGAFLPITTNRNLHLSSTKSSGSGMEEALRGIRARLKRTSTGLIVATRDFQMRALAQILNEG